VAQLDTKITFGVTGAVTEVHVGNPQGSSGQNAQGPSDAPIIGQKVVIKLFVVSDIGRRSLLLSSTRSTRWWQSFLPR
jgi:hypothetical protein